MEGEASKEAAGQARVKMWNFALGFTTIGVLKSAIDLGIADALESRQVPTTLAELSSTLECSPSALYRIMRFLIHHGIFKEETTTKGHKGYAQTELSRLLVKNAENSMAPLLMYEFAPVMLAPCLALTSRVLDKGTSDSEAPNLALSDPDHDKLHTAAWSMDAKAAVAAVVHGCPEVFGGMRSLVDVGGGDGTTLCELIKSFPFIRGINYDLPHVVSTLPNYKGVKHIGGDMFVSVPEANTALLKWVLHERRDAECIQILKNCRKAISKGTGKVIILESVLDEKKENKYNEVGLLLDMLMMAHTNSGKERTIEEWGYIIEQAGFSRYTVTNIEAVQSVIVAYH
jgi:hypothetical protein